MSFETARGSLVLRTRRPDADGALALDELLGAWWQPVHVSTLAPVGSRSPMALRPSR